MLSITPTSHVVSNLDFSSWGMACFCSKRKKIKSNKPGEGIMHKKAEFLEGHTYQYATWQHGIKTLMKIFVKERNGCFATVNIDGLCLDLVAILPDGDAEFMIFRVSWPCVGEKIYPYNLLS